MRVIRELLYRRIKEWKPRQAENELTKLKKLKNGS
jgi:hypothetical protein